MGHYINPEGRTKESWLDEHGQKLSKKPTEETFNELLGEGKYIVCWVHNGPFTAAGIVDCLSELQAFNVPGDKRPKIWMSAPISKLLEVCPTLRKFRL